MSNDDLLRALGRLSARQAEEADEDPALRHLSAPPPLETRQRLADQAMAALHGRPQQESESVARPVRWFQQLYARRTLLLATPALGAAAALLVFTRRRGGGPIPAYTMQLTGGVATLRGTTPDSDAPLPVAEGSRVELRLRPERDLPAGDLEVQLYWSRGGQRERWTATTEISPQGAVRVVGTAPRPFGPGDGELIAVVGRPGGPWQTLRAPVRWR
jgi:hypothetical protein